jgi:hypothetical protein
MVPIVVVLRGFLQFGPTLAFSARRRNNTQNLVKQYSLIDLLVVKMKVILMPGLLLRAEKDRRMRLFPVNRKIL